MLVNNLMLMEQKSWNSTARAVQNPESLQCSHTRVILYLQKRQQFQAFKKKKIY